MERRAWWHGKTAYQIYPKSFYDANGDGIGDLRGVLQKLDYLAELGIEILWLSPCYQSPLADQGYDISDYYRLDPRFGTMEDLEELIHEAKKRGISILMDLVVNHCSDEHEWFQKACQDPDGPYGKFFYIEDYDGQHLPCNWRSYFGGPCWDLLPCHTDKVYLHVFHRKQPDLNWENPLLRAEIYRMIRWWLEKGIAGFRIDAIINIKKLLPWQDFPADRDDGLCSIDRMLERAEGIGAFLTELQQQAFRPYDAFTVGEVFNLKQDQMGDFIGPDGYFSTMFDFAETLAGQDARGWYACTPPDAETYKACCFRTQRLVGEQGLISNIIENHDEPRGVSHYLPDADRSEISKTCLGGLNFCLRGLPFLYQGQEIGMENMVFHSIEEIDDISSQEEYRVALAAGCTPQEALAAVAHYSRDNARTPMQWDASPNAGFTTGTPWLHVNPNYTWLNVAEQRGRDNSVYQFYRRLIGLRKQSDCADTLVYGRCTPYREEQRNLMAYFREGEAQRLLVLGNLQREPQTVPLPGPVKEVRLTNGGEMQRTTGELTLGGYAFAILELA